jgi:hypothetical protein
VPELFEVHLADEPAITSSEMRERYGDRRRGQEVVVDSDLPPVVGPVLKRELDSY